MSDKPKRTVILNGPGTILGIAAMVALAQAQGADFGPPLERESAPPPPDLGDDDEYPYDGEELMKFAEFMEGVRARCYNEHDGDAYAIRSTVKDKAPLDWSKIGEWSKATDIQVVLWVSK